MKVAGQSLASGRLFWPTTGPNVDSTAVYYAGVINFMSSSKYNQNTWVVVFFFLVIKNTFRILLAML